MFRIAHDLGPRVLRRVAIPLLPVVSLDKKSYNRTGYGVVD